MQLTGKVALITGAGSGIGKATAVLMASEGAKVAALSHTANEIQKTVAEIQQGQGEGLALVADVRDELQMQQAIQQIIDRWGRLDIVLANAGINGVWAPLEEISLDDWSLTLTNNLTSTFLTAKYAAPYLKKQGGALIVISSVNGTRVFSNPGTSAYATSKAGQVALAKVLALELAQNSVRVNIICPGATETGIKENTHKVDVEKIRLPEESAKRSIPLGDGKPATAEQVARLAIFLASDAGSYISGSEIWIDGASSLLR